MIRVENAGAEPHEVGLLKLAPGKTIEDFEAWIQNPQGPPPANSIGGVSSLAANTNAYFEVDLASGDYVLSPSSLISCAMWNWSPLFTSWNVMNPASIVSCASKA